MLLINYNACVYVIYAGNQVPLYVGSTTDIKTRYEHHHSKLLNNTHENYLLQNYINNVGIDNIIMVPVFYCDEKDLILNESRFINFLRPAFNLAHNSGMKIQISEEDELINVIKKRFNGANVPISELLEWCHVNGYHDLNLKNLGKRTKVFKKIKKRSDNNRIYVCVR